MGLKRDVLKRVTSRPDPGYGGTAGYKKSLALLAK